MASPYAVGLIGFTHTPSRIFGHKLIHFLVLQALTEDQKRHKYFKVMYICHSVLAVPVSTNDDLNGLSFCCEVIGWKRF